MAVAPTNDDLLSPEAIRDPHALLRRFAERGPIFWHERWDGFVVTSHAACVTGLQDPAFSSAAFARFEATLPQERRDRWRPIFDVLGRSMVYRDPPDHTRLRALVNKAFTRRAVEEVRPTIEAVVSNLIGDLSERDVIDVIEDFSAPLPVLVIAQMIGADAADAKRLKAWSDDAAALMLGALEDRDRHDRAARGIGEMARYFRALVVERRAKPGSDLVSSLIAAQERGETLSEDELIAMCVLLMFAGHETTTNLIANGVLALLDHPDQLANARPMTPAGVEEVLRFDGPMKATTRTATAPTEVAGTRIEPGQRVLFSLFAANRDASRFSQPDTFDLTRKENPHLGFGYATHYCTGAPLARAEGLIGLTALMARPGMELAVPRTELEWHPSLLARTLKRLPVRFRR